MCVFDLLYELCPKYFPFEEEYSEILSNVYWSPCTIPVNSLYILLKLEFSKQIFENCSKIRFHYIRQRTSNYKISWIYEQWETSCSMWGDM
jgi:hypothetical protein